MSQTQLPGVDARALMRYDIEKKSMLLAYVIWYFVGMFGGHRFYMGQKSSAIWMLVIFIASLVLSVIGIGLIGMLALVIWWAIDGCRLWKWVKVHNLALMNQLSYQPQ